MDLLLLRVKKRLGSRSTPDLAPSQMELKMCNDTMVINKSEYFGISEGKLQSNLIEDGLTPAQAKLVVRRLIGYAK